MRWENNKKYQVICSNNIRRSRRGTEWLNNKWTRRKAETLDPLAVLIVEQSIKTKNQGWMS